MCRALLLIIILILAHAAYAAQCSLPVLVIELHGEGVEDLLQSRLRH